MDAKESKVWRVPELGNSDLLVARHQNHSFPRHTHEQYAIGTIEKGALGFYYRGANMVALQGDINLCIPGEPHTGQPATTDGWSYRMFYLDPQLLQQIASQIADCPQSLPYFRSGVLQDAAIASAINQLHRLLEVPQSSKIERESRLLEVIAAMICRHADQSFSPSPIGKEPASVAKIKQYIEDHYREDISLDSLSNMTHLSPFHLIRTFQAVAGISPHAYLRQIRVARAKEMLANGLSIATVAQETGFVDQSHLTRWFKRFWGFTPAQYRNSVQDARPSRW